MHAFLIDGWHLSAMIVRLQTARGRQTSWKDRSCLPQTMATTQLVMPGRTRLPPSLMYLNKSASTICPRVLQVFLVLLLYLSAEA